MFYYPNQMKFYSEEFDRNIGISPQLLLLVFYSKQGAIDLLYHFIQFPKCSHAFMAIDSFFCIKISISRDGEKRFDTYIWLFIPLLGTETVSTLQCHFCDFDNKSREKENEEVDPLVK